MTDFKNKMVVIPRGTQIHSTHPSHDRDGQTSTRKQIVLVHDSDVWKCPNAQKMDCIKILWVGSGGYWKWAWFPHDIKLEVVTDDD